MNKNDRIVLVGRCLEPADLEKSERIFVEVLLMIGIDQVVFAERDVRHPYDQKSAAMAQDLRQNFAKGEQGKPKCSNA